MMHILSKSSAALALALVFAAAGCNKQADNPAQTQEQQDPNYDPASANMAPADQSAAPVNESAAAAPARSSVPAPQPSSQATTSAEDNVPPPPPDETESYPEDNTVPPTEVSSDQSGYYDDSVVEQPVYAPQPPPPLPVYEQPPCPGPNYIWTPGYWAYQPVGYYWVPGVWVIAPYIGALWTPGYWGWGNNRYFWHHGYWGPHIGYYGGINYGHGYVGRGYYGGYWNHNNFYYNRSITNVNTTIVKNVYVHNVTINNVTINNYNSNNRVSYNGPGGTVCITRAASASADCADRTHASGGTGPFAVLQREPRPSADGGIEPPTGYAFPCAGRTTSGAGSGQSWIRRAHSRKSPNCPAATHAGTTSGSQTGCGEPRAA